VSVRQAVSIRGANQAQSASDGAGDWLMTWKPSARSSLCKPQLFRGLGRSSAFHRTVPPAIAARHAEFARRLSLRRELRRLRQTGAGGKAIRGEAASLPAQIGKCVLERSTRDSDHSV
jgi:hypothetical protein